MLSFKKYCHFYKACKLVVQAAKSIQVTLAQKKVMMMNKVIRDKSKCANCMSDKSRFLK